jgi:hypothetical protein
MIEEALKGKRKFTTIEMVKRDGEWHAHFTLKKVVEIMDRSETIIVEWIMVFIIWNRKLENS